MAGGPMPPQQQQQQQLYDSVTDNYEQAGNYQQAGANAQNFGNPYDCPEGMYGGSMVSSVGYSKVSKGMRVERIINFEPILTTSAQLSASS